VRHPRYLGLMGSRIGFALAIASIAAWVFAIGWFFLIRQRIKNEEDHLTNIFGSTYKDYARRTARLLPGVY
jgi:protein-S-isoprenylcysteine O-methyltransferase Ste14